MEEKKSFADRKRSVRGTAVYGNLFVREHLLLKDQQHQGHRHYIDHVTFVASGTVLVKIGDANPVEYTGPCFIPIDKDIWHQFTSISDQTVYFCVFSIPDKFEESILPNKVELFGHHREDLLKKTLCGNCTGCAIPPIFDDVTEPSTGENVPQ